MAAGLPLAARGRGGRNPGPDRGTAPIPPNRSADNGLARTGGFLARRGVQAPNPACSLQIRWREAPIGRHESPVAALPPQSLEPRSPEDRMTPRRSLRPRARVTALAIPHKWPLVIAAAFALIALLCVLARADQA